MSLPEKNMPTAPPVEFSDKIQRLQKLKLEEAELDEKLRSLQNAHTNKVKVMDALHEYNDIKDATQIVLGQLADLYGVTVTKLHEKFNLNSSD